MNCILVAMARVVDALSRLGAVLGILAGVLAGISFVLGEPAHSGIVTSLVFVAIALILFAAVAGLVTYIMFIWLNPEYKPPRSGF